METHRHKHSYFRKYTATDVAYCGFEETVVTGKLPKTGIPESFSSKPTCEDCEEAYAMDSLARLP